MTTEDAVKVSNGMGYPVLIKATAGGGGKGMQVAHNDADVREKYTIARNEARANFGNDEVFIEKYLGRPRHVEVQILADNYGNVVHLGERDCSVQRRHQKVWEEAPSPVITEKQRHDIGMRCVNAMKKLGYRGLGTVEFLYEDGQFFFIEMNTRVQVEHPVTEAVTGIDLVREQIRVAAGEALDITQDDIKINGHAIECRINAEDPENFMPSPGRIDFNHPPGGYGVRVDSAIYTGYTVPPHYDSMVAKLIVWGHDRQECIVRTRRALSEYVISGIKTTIPLHKKISLDEKMVKGDYTIHWLEREFLKK
jgi:acetyl-CoA carboxylase biotin carboxylase subunit